MLMDCSQVQLALVLAEAGCSFVVVGSAASFLRGSDWTPRDLDLVVRPEREAALDAALVSVGVPRRVRCRVLPSPRRVLTSWSTVDVFVEDVVPVWSEVVLDGVGLRVLHE